MDPLAGLPLEGSPGISFGQAGSGNGKGITEKELAENRYAGSKFIYSQCALPLPALQPISSLQDVHHEQPSGAMVCFNYPCLPQTSKSHLPSIHKTSDCPNRGS